jgi:hypothetical protein
LLCLSPPSTESMHRTLLTFSLPARLGFRSDSEGGREGAEVGGYGCVTQRAGHRRSWCIRHHTARGSEWSVGLVMRMNGKLRRNHVFSRLRARMGRMADEYVDAP